MKFSCIIGRYISYNILYSTSDYEFQNTYPRGTLVPPNILDIIGEQVERALSVGVFEWPAGNNIDEPHDVFLGVF